MELTYNELSKRDVINIVDGKCLGRITDMKFRFPQGTIQGIEVEGRRVCFLFRAFNRSNLYIPDSNIVKIGGDVILVNLKCGETCLESVSTTNTGGKSKKPQSPCPPPCPPSPPPCPPSPCQGSSLLGEHEEGTQFNFDDY